MKKSILFILLSLVVFACGNDDFSEIELVPEVPVDPLIPDPVIIGKENKETKDSNGNTTTNTEKVEEVKTNEATESKENKDNKEEDKKENRASKGRDCPGSIKITFNLSLFLNKSTNESCLRKCFQSYTN